MPLRDSETTVAGSGVSAWEAARQAGFDMDLLEDSLQRSPAERLRLHDLALATANMLRRAMKERDRAIDPDQEPDRG